jgi:hypothetical protein
MEVSANSFSAIAQARTKNEIDVAVAKKALDTQRQQGAAVVEMLKSAADTADANKTTGGLDITG